MRTCDHSGCDNKHRARGLCVTHYNQQMNPDQRHRKVIRTCDVCGSEWLTTRTSGRFCSDECKGTAYQTEKRTRSRELVHVPHPDPVCWLPKQHPVITPRPTPRSHLWFAGSCAWCGDSFTDWQPAARYCSPRCTKRDLKARRRSRKGEFAISRKARVSIYERDEWTCQLCLEPVDPAALDIWRPSLDHIVPQSLGGAHAPDNLRLAHMWCNSVRGNEKRHRADVLRMSPAA